DIPDRVDRIRRRACRHQFAGAAWGLSQCAGARARSAGCGFAFVAGLAAPLGFPPLLRILADACAGVSRGSDCAAVWIITRRFSLVSTVAVAGKRQDEVVTEDRAIEWDRSDYDPYARTKKFCEHMTRQLLPEVPITIFRPSIVLGDSRYPQTTQFDMVRAFV